MDDSKTHRFIHDEINRLQTPNLLATFMTTLVVVDAWEEANGHNFAKTRPV